MAKKIKMERAKLIERLVEDAKNWDSQILRDAAVAARKADLEGMSDEELIEEAEQACLEGDWENIKLTGPADDSAELVEKIVEAAKNHGEDSEAGMEVGDLQEALRAAWKELTPAARKRVFGELELWES